MFMLPVNLVINPKLLAIMPGPVVVVSNLVKEIAVWITYLYVNARKRRQMNLLNPFHFQ